MAHMNEECEVCHWNMRNQVIRAQHRTRHSRKKNFFTCFKCSFWSFDAQRMLDHRCNASRWSCDDCGMKTGLYKEYEAHLCHARNQNPVEQSGYTANEAQHDEAQDRREVQHGQPAVLGPSVHAREPASGPVRPAFSSRISQSYRPLRPYPPTATVVPAATIRSATRSQLPAAPTGYASPLGLYHATSSNWNARAPGIPTTAPVVSPRALIPRATIPVVHVFWRPYAIRTAQTSQPYHQDATFVSPAGRFVPPQAAPTGDNFVVTDLPNRSQPTASAAQQRVRAWIHQQEVLNLQGNRTI